MPPVEKLSHGDLVRYQSAQKELGLTDDEIRDLASERLTFGDRIWRAMTNDGSDLQFLINMRLKLDEAGRTGAVNEVREDDSAVYEQCGAVILEQIGEEQYAKVQTLCRGDARMMEAILDSYYHYPKAEFFIHCLDYYLKFVNLIAGNLQNYYRLSSVFHEFFCEFQYKKKTAGMAAFVGVSEIYGEDFELMGVISKLVRTHEITNPALMLEVHRYYGFGSPEWDEMFVETPELARAMSPIAKGASGSRDEFERKKALVERCLSGHHSEWIAGAFAQGKELFGDDEEMFERYAGLVRKGASTVNSFLKTRRFFLDRPELFGKFVSLAEESPYVCNLFVKLGTLCSADESMLTTFYDVVMGSSFDSFSYQDNVKIIVRVQCLYKSDSALFRTLVDLFAAGGSGLVDSFSANSDFLLANPALFNKLLSVAQSSPETCKLLLGANSDFLLANPALFNKLLSVAQSSPETCKLLLGANSDFLLANPALFNKLLSVAQSSPETCKLLLGASSLYGTDENRVDLVATVAEAYGKPAISSLEYAKRHGAVDEVGDFQIAADFFGISPSFKGKVLVRYLALYKTEGSDAAEQYLEKDLAWLSTEPQCEPAYVKAAGGRVYMTGKGINTQDERARNLARSAFVERIVAQHVIDYVSERYAASSLADTASLYLGPEAAEPRSASALTDLIGAIFRQDKDSEFEAYLSETSHYLHGERLIPCLEGAFRDRLKKMRDDDEDFADASAEFIARVSEPGHDEKKKYTLFATAMGTYKRGGFYDNPLCGDYESYEALLSLVAKGLDSGELMQCIDTFYRAKVGEVAAASDDFLGNNYEWVCEDAKAKNNVAVLSSVSKMTSSRPAILKAVGTLFELGNLDEIVELLIYSIDLHTLAYFDSSGPGRYSLDTTRPYSAPPGPSISNMKHTVFDFVCTHLDDFSSYPDAQFFVATYINDDRRAQFALNSLGVTGHFDLITRVRTDAKSRSRRHAAMTVLERHVNRIDSVHTLQIIGQYGLQKEGRLAAVAKLQGIGAKTQLSAIERAEGPSSYKDPEVSAAAGAAIEELERAKAASEPSD